MKFQIISGSIRANLLNELKTIDDEYLKEVHSFKTAFRIWFFRAWIATTNFVESRQIIASTLRVTFVFTKIA